MILISQIRSYFTSLVVDFDEIKESIVVFNQGHLADKIKELSPGIYLIVVIPGAKTKAVDDDNVRDPSECLVFLSEKLNEKDIGPDGLINRMNATQVLMERVKTRMIDDKRKHETPGHLMHDLEPHGMSTEPEWNYLGTYGWSLSFILNPILRQL